MWYTYAYFNSYNNKKIGIGGNIVLHSNRKENNKNKSHNTSINKVKKYYTPVEKTPLMKKLELLHTNGRNYIPPTSMIGISPPAAIEDQYIETQNISSIAGNTGQGYELNYM